MDIKEDATQFVRLALKKHMPVIVLRGIDEFASPDGDIDILVPRNCAENALSILIELAEKEPWSIVDVRDIGYISQLCLLKKSPVDNCSQTVKLDIWNGLSWAAIGKDVFGDTLFNVLKERGEIDVAGLTTVLQKFMYAGFLRARDKERVFSACEIDRVLAFSVEHEIPLTRTDLEDGKISYMARWRLRSASSGVTYASMPIWIVNVLWRTLLFRVFGSRIHGKIIVISGGSFKRRSSLIQTFSSLVSQSGFPAPVTLSRCKREVGEGNNSEVLGIWGWVSITTFSWVSAFRGETVMINEAFIPTYSRVIPKVNLSDLFVKLSSVLFSHNALVVRLSSDYSQLKDESTVTTLAARRRIANLLPLLPRRKELFDDSGGVRNFDIDLDFLISRIRVTAGYTVAHRE